MNIHVLNRLLVMLFSGLAAIFWSGLVFAVWWYPRQLGGSLRQVGALIASADPIMQMMVSLLALAVVLVAFLVLLSEFMPEGMDVVRLPQINGGAAVISVESLAQVIKHEAEAVPQVLSARPKVTSLGHQVDVEVELRTDPLVHVAAKTEEVCAAIRTVLEERTGVEIAHLSVSLRTDPVGLGPRTWPSSSATSRTGERREIVIPGSGSQEAPAAVEAVAAEGTDARPERVEGSRV